MSAINCSSSAYGIVILRLFGIISVDKVIMSESCKFHQLCSLLRTIYTSADSEKFRHFYWLLIYRSQAILQNVTLQLDLREALVDCPNSQVLWIVCNFRKSPLNENECGVCWQYCHLHVVQYLTTTIICKIMFAPFVAVYF
jgi:hypothetical protein